MKNVAEEQITPQVTQHVAPDINPQDLQTKAAAATRMKGVLDKAFNLAATQVKGATFNSRIKNLDVAQKKIVQKRMEGRNYGIDDLNDLYGGRFTVEKPGDFKKVKAELTDMEKAGLFQITKQETVKTGNYEAYHTDITAPDGTKGEVQIHLPQSEAESVANHDLRAIHGEKPPDGVQRLVDTQAGITQGLSNDKARTATHALQTLHKINNDKPINPVITAQVLRRVQNPSVLPQRQ